MTQPPEHSSPQTPQGTPQGHLVTIRIIWAALLMGQLLFFLVIAFVLWPQGRKSGDPQFLRLLFFAECAMLLTAVPIGFVLRSQTFHKGRDESGNVRPAAYVTGNIILWATCEGASFFGLVGALLNNGPWPHLIITIIAVTVQLMTFPTGAPMRESI